MNNSQFCYVITYGNDSRIAVTESALPSIISYLNRISESSIKLGGHSFRPISMIWTELTDDVRNRMNILDESSFKYRITGTNKDTRETVIMYVDADSFSQVWQSLAQEGYTLRDFTWGCPVIDHFKNVEMIQQTMNNADNDHWTQKDKFGDMCGKLFDQDPALEPLIAAIRSKADQADKDDLRRLSEMLEGILQQYAS